MPLFFTGLLLACLVLIQGNANAQDKIYSNSGVTTCKIIDINTISVTYLPLKSSKAVTVYVNKVVLLFNDKGVYLRPSKMDFSLKQNQQMVRKFLQSKTADLSSSQIFKTDNSMVDGDITKEDKNFVYLDKEDKKIDKKNVIAIIYKDGHHSIIGPVSKAADVLWTVYEDNLKSTDVASGSTKKDTVPARTTAYNDITSKQTSTQQKAPVKETTIVETPPRVTKTIAPDVIAANEAKAKQQTVASSSANSTTLVEQKIAPGEAKPVITDFLSLPEKEEFEKKATEKTVQFSNYLKIILDKTTAMEEAIKASQQALLLFVNDRVMIEVSSLNRNPVRQLIGPYLDHLRQLNYDRIEVKWTHVQYVTQLKKNMDGNYTGTVTFEQEFRGYKDGKLVYSDVTKKKALVILKAYDKFVEGTVVKHWDVLLGDIGVESTRSL